LTPKKCLNVFFSKKKFFQWRSKNFGKKFFCPKTDLNHLKMVFDLFGVIFSKKNFLTFLVLQGGGLTKKKIFLLQIDSWPLKSAQMCFLAKKFFFILGQKEGSVSPKRSIEISNGRILDKKTPRVMPRDTIRIVITKKSGRRRRRVVVESSGYL
jgi:hypothetical protein